MGTNWFVYRISFNKRRPSTGAAPHNATLIKNLNIIQAQPDLNVYRTSVQTMKSKNKQ